MRGDDRQQDGMFSYLSPEARIPRDHPMRPIRAMVDAILKDLSPAFDDLISGPASSSTLPSPREKTM